ncbi:hypothetical protein ACSBQY_02555 [Micrococcus lylae]|uniref:hypothetical protein n=1 Tax=Micrococcus lylae TaxID=1273 RepID=UPI003EB8C411
MEYLVPVLAVVVIGALATGVTVWLGKRPKPERHAASDAGPSGGVSAERARHASSLLSEDAHRAVYGRIATNRPMEAITEYRRVTGRSLRDSMVDVQSLAAYPQVYTLPQDQDPVQDDAPNAAPVDTREAGPAGNVEAPGKTSPEAGTDRLDGTAPSGADAARQEAEDTQGERAEQDERPSSRSTEDAQAGPAHGDGLPELPDDLMVPAEWSAEPAPEDRPFEVEVMRGDATVHLSSRDLPPWLRDQLSAMMRDGNLETAAVQLSTHTELSVPEAFELLRRIQESRGQ